MLVLAHALRTKSEQKLLKNEQAAPAAPAGSTSSRIELVWPYAAGQPLRSFIFPRSGQRKRYERRTLVPIIWTGTVVRHDLFSVRYRVFFILDNLVVSLVLTWTISVQSTGLRAAYLSFHDRAVAKIGNVWNA